jgi:TniB protein
MDARIWHNFCATDIPEEPAPLTLRRWKTMSDQQRSDHTDQLRRWLAHLYIQTDELTAICKAMAETVQTNAGSPPGAKRVLALTGPNAIGKSTLMMRWGRNSYHGWTSAADHDQRGRPVLYPTEDCEADLCPVVWINLPAGAKIKDFDVAILEFFGLPGEGRISSLTTRAVQAAERHQTQVLIDAHLLKTDWKGGRDVLDHVKHINTELGEIGATLILVGANLEDSDLVNDPQIAGRLNLQRFPRYGIDTVAEMRVWQGIVRRLEILVLDHLPAGKPGMLYLQLPGELWHRTQGYLGDLTDLVSQATLAATNEGTHRILQRHLNKVELSERAKNERRELETVGRNPKP